MCLKGRYWDCKPEFLDDFTDIFKPPSSYQYVGAFARTVLSLFVVSNFLAIEPWRIVIVMYDD